MGIITKQAIADQLGISRSSVSVVLNDTGNRISPRLRGRIITAAKKLGYPIHTPQERKVFGLISSVGIVTRQIFDREAMAANQSYVSLEVFAGISAELARHGIAATLIHPTRHLDEKKIGKLMLAGRFDALIFSSPDWLDLVFKAMRSGIPYVVIGHSEIRDINNVRGDDEYGAYAAAAHLLELGHRRLMYFGAETARYAHGLRFSGFRRALRERGVPFEDRLYLRGGSNFAACREAVANFLRGEMGTTITAIATDSDLRAAAAIEAIRAAGLKIPGDLSVVGFDDAPYAEQLEPPLTTSKKNRFKIGREAVRILFEQTEKKTSAPIDRMIKNKLMIRASTAELIRRVRTLAQLKK